MSSFSLLASVVASALSAFLGAGPLALDTWQWTEAFAGRCSSLEPTQPAAEAGKCYGGFAAKVRTYSVSSGRLRRGATSGAFREVWSGFDDVNGVNSSDNTRPSLQVSDGLNLRR